MFHIHIFFLELNKFDITELSYKTDSYIYLLLFKRSTVTKMGDLFSVN